MLLAVLISKLQNYSKSLVQNAWLTEPMKASVKFLLITCHRTVVWASKYRNKVHENRSFLLESIHQLEHNWSEEMAGTLLDSSQMQPSLWFRYGDDTFEVWSHGKVTMTHSYPAYCKTRNRLQNGLILRTHWKWKYALILCRNDHFAHCPSTWTLPATSRVEVELQTRAFYSGFCLKASS